MCYSNLTSDDNACFVPLLSFSFSPVMFELCSSLLLGGDRTFLLLSVIAYALMEPLGGERTFLFLSHRSAYTCSKNVR